MRIILHGSNQNMMVSELSVKCEALLCDSLLLIFHVSSKHDSEFYAGAGQLCVCECVYVYDVQLSGSE